MSNKIQPMSRRTVLKGLGVSMCLPLLEAMGADVAGAEERNKSKGKAGAAQRLAVLYMPNGVNPHAWTPTGTGNNFELSPILKPLESLKSEILVLTELMNQQSIEGDGHYAKVAPFLTGTHITKTTGSNLRCGGVSLDQLVAQHLGNLTQLPSLELSIEPPTTYVDTNVGYTALYGSHISWSSPTTPVSRELNPQLAFDRLFRSTTGQVSKTSPKDRSVLDAVMEDARSLKTQIGSADRLKLDEYFDSVRSVEKRIAFDAARRSGEYHADPEALKEIDKLGAKIKDYYADPKVHERIDHTEQVRIMFDIITLAFWTDSTRVSTFMFGNEVTGKNFSFIPGVSGSFHEISHHQDDKGKLEEYKKINAWHVEQYAYLLNRLRSIKEGDKTLLDNSMIVMGGGIKDGNSHSPENLPILIGGRGGGKVATGRHLVYDAKTPLCNLYHGMLNVLDIPTLKFGDSSGALAGLTDPNYRGKTT